ncbi:hypothetical protein EYF80_054838 [Liparis tanakae]|uniref:Uncharacterized protein n=1 Tax=Liparis tanakae TaxID=230148 RepID=A0A4Z2F211_9TELE|nr:hypothetical protein EYF80_054838 [Liparis tanakae]
MSPACMKDLRGEECLPEWILRLSFVELDHIPAGKPATFSTHTCNIGKLHQGQRRYEGIR